ncbi:TonB-dependent receptor [Usitatibacter rugosus]|uniref:TonB-dependent receptor n=1 Tax=Usitatibacter rugosus TaxID=2732067 RepID=UPI001BB17607|nr:TonB-dependent receptor [Usitatibacter rugosus]
MLAFPCSLAIGVAGHASAQQTPPPPKAEGEKVEKQDRITVTATKRETSLQDVPFSINAQTEEDIRRSGSQTLEDLSRNIAGVAIQNLGPGQSQVSIRGVSSGQIVRDQPGVKEQVGVYLDETAISMSLFTPDLDLFDLNRVETLRGPQGTLYGSGNIGGTIRYITNEARLRVNEGVVEVNANTISGGSAGGSVKGALNVPMGDAAAMRIVGFATRFGGWADALGPASGKDVNEGDRVGGRLSFTFQPSRDVTIQPRIVYQKSTYDGFNRQENYNLYANPYTTTVPPTTFGEDQQYLLQREKFEDKTTIADLVAKVGFGSFDLTSVTTYTDRDVLVSRDASALTGSVSVDLGFPTAGVLLPSRLNDTTDFKGFTQELRLSSKAPGPFQWLVGAFYADADRKYAQRLPTPGYDTATDATLGAGTSAGVANGFPANSPYNADIIYNLKQAALFGEFSYDLTSQLTGTAGLRYYDYKEERTFRSGGLFANGDNQSDETKSDGFNPRFLLAYRMAPGVTWNAQASKGFRLGGVNDPLNIPLCTAQDRAIFGGYQRFEDESLWNYEVGVKMQKPGMTFNAAVFHTQMENLQVTLDAGSCSSRVVFNVPKAHTTGVEAELVFRPNDSWEVGFAGSAVNAEFDSTVTDGTGAVIGGIREGNRLPSVPKVQFTASLTYNFNLAGRESYVTASYQYIGSRFTQPSDQENNPRTFVHGLPFLGAPATASTTLDLELPKYNLVNLSAGMEFSRGFSAIVYVNNLTDERALLSFDRERGGRARLGYTTNQPRTVGVTLRKSF